MDFISDNAEAEAEGQRIHDALYKPPAATSNPYFMAAGAVNSTTDDETAYNAMYPAPMPARNPFRVTPKLERAGAGIYRDRTDWGAVNRAAARR